MTGRVLNRADLPLPQVRWDLLVIGGGALGLASAFYLRRLLPDASLLVVEQGGVPSEEGATFVSPAVAHRALPDGPPIWRAAADWSLRVLADPRAEVGGDRRDEALRPVGWWRFTAADGGAVPPGLEARTAADALGSLPAAGRGAVEALFDLGGLDAVLVDPLGGYGGAEALALHYGFAAVRAGADLALNTRALPLDEERVRLERLAYTRTMATEVAVREEVEVGAVVVAAGTAAGGLVEAGLDRVIVAPRAYRQYPRVEADPRLPLDGGRVALPAVEVEGVTVRPQGEGLLVVPPPHGADPAGYRPVGGRLFGVPVGVRREALEGLLAREGRLRLLAWESFNLGKTVGGVRGAWQALTPAGLPRIERIDGTTWWLAQGGEHGFTLLPAAAAELAARVAGVPGRPWT